MGSVKIIDNFLEKNKFNELKKILFSDEMIWYWQDHQTGDKPGYFTNNLYKNHYPTSDIFTKYIYDICLKLNTIALVNVRANLIINKKIEISSDWHTDWGKDDNITNFKTAIFYMNTCNGYTVLQEEGYEEFKIPSEENKMLIFNKNILHRGVSQTDEERRIVINFNYY